MTRPSIATLLLAIVSIFLALGLFLAGAMWRARTTSGRADNHGQLHVQRNGLTFLRTQNHDDEFNS